MKDYKHVTVTIEQDDDPENPRDAFDNASSVFYGVKGRFLIGGKNDTEYSHASDMEEAIEQFRKEKAVVVEFRTDAGQQYAVIDRETVHGEWGKGRGCVQKAIKCAEAEIEVWQQWCDGEVYGYIIKNMDGDTLDSCWGFYGLEYCQQEAERVADHYEAKIEEDKKKIMQRLADVTA